MVDLGVKRQDMLFNGTFAAPNIHPGEQTISKTFSNRMEVLAYQV